MKKIIRKSIYFLVTLCSFSQKLQEILMWPIASRLLGLSYSEPIHLKNGIVLYGSMHDILTRNILFLGERIEYFWEPITTQLAEKLAKDAKEVFVAGSHVGYDVFTIAKKVGKGGRVHTFEPVSELFALVERSRKANMGLPVLAHHMALSSTVGTVPIKNDTIRSMVVKEEDATEFTPCTTVPTYMKEYGISQIDVMLIDVEGHEIDVFKPMREVLISDTAPDIIYEVILRKKAGEPEECISLMLEECGYRTYTILDDYHGGGNVPSKVAITEKTGMIQARYLNVFATKKSEAEIRSLGIEIV